MFGIFIDVTQRKQAEESSDLLAGEMSHRVKNLLQLATSLTQIKSRSSVTKEDMVRDLTHRLTALGRAHDLVRPGPDQQKNERALLGDLISVLLAPYDEIDASVRIRVSVPKVNVSGLQVPRWHLLFTNLLRTLPNMARSQSLVERWMFRAMRMTMTS
jgi:two-component sensor histidine kinase